VLIWSSSVDLGSSAAGGAFGNLLQIDAPNVTLGSATGSVYARNLDAAGTTPVNLLELRCE
jgi:hypothetical protein